MQIYSTLLVIVANIHAIIWCHASTRSNWEKSAITIDIASSQAQTIGLDSARDCNRFNCFISLNCQLTKSKELPYYVYPPAKFLDANGELIYDTLSMISMEYWNVLETIISSSRFTSDPEKACILVPSIDLTWISRLDQKTISAIYSSLPHWSMIDGQSGTNHMVIALDPAQTPSDILVSIGRSILVATNHDTWTYRPEFDLNVPYIPEPETVDQRKVGLEQNRRLKLISTQYGSVGSKTRRAIEKLESYMDADFLVLSHSCNRSLNSDVEGSLKCDWEARHELENSFDKTTCRCSKNGSNGLKFPHVMASSSYCLILHLNEAPVGDSSHYLLSQSMRFGCVPIISNDFIPPLKTDLEWRKILISLTNPEDFSSLPSLIRSINQNDLQMRQELAVKTWQKHFNDYGRLANDILRHYDSLVYPQALLNKHKDEL